MLRDTSVADRRIKHSRASTAGHRLLREVDAGIERTQARTLAPLRPEQRRAFIRLLSPLVESNNELSRAPAGKAA